MVVIAGAGIAGSSLSREFARQGVPSEVVAPDNGSSVAALCLLRKAWMSPGPRREAVREALEQYYDLDAIVATQATWTNGDRIAELRDDWYLIDIRKLLVQPSGTWLPADTSRQAVWAIGAHSAGTYTWGVTYRSTTAELMTKAHSWVHQIRPYRQVSAVRVNGEVRVGSSVADTLEKAKFEAERLLEVAHRRNMVRGEDWVPVVGKRLNSPPGLALDLYSFRNHRSARVGGFGRTGFSLAPTVARLFVQEWLRQQGG